MSVCLPSPFPSPPMASRGGPRHTPAGFTSRFLSTAAVFFLLLACVPAASDPADEKAATSSSPAVATKLARARACSQGRCSSPTAYDVTAELNALLNPKREEDVVVPAIAASGRDLQPGRAATVPVSDKVQTALRALVKGLRHRVDKLKEEGHLEYDQKKFRELGCIAMATPAIPAFSGVVSLYPSAYAARVSVSLPPLETFFSSECDNQLTPLALNLHSKRTELIPGEGALNLDGVCNDSVVAARPLLPPAGEEAGAPQGPQGPRGPPCVPLMSLGTAAEGAPRRGHPPDLLHPLTMAAGEAAGPAVAGGG
ncbi:hypothetical protein Efla_007901 [Eimeria flavescens]